MQKCNSIYVWAKLKGLPSKIRWPVELLCYKTYDDQDIAEVYSKSDDMVYTVKKTDVEQDDHNDWEHIGLKYLEKKGKIKAQFEEDLSCLKDHSRKSTKKDCQHYCILTSGLNQTQREEVEMVCQKFGWENTNSYHPKVTHLVMKTEPEESRMCERTLKFLQGISRHVFIVNFLWIQNQGNTGAYQPEKNYEIVGDTVSMKKHHGPYLSRTQPNFLLLKGFCIYLIGQAEDLTKDDLIELITACGGEVISSSKVCQDSVVVTCYNHEGEDIDVLSPDERDEVKQVYKDYGLHAISRDWIIDSLTCFAVQPMDTYRHMDHRDSTKKRKDTGDSGSSSDLDEEDSGSDLDEDGIDHDENDIASKVDSKRKRRTDSSSDLDEEDSSSDLDEEGIDHDENDIASKVDSKKRPTDSSSDLDEEGIDHDENDIASKVDSKRKRRTDSSSDLDEEGIDHDENDIASKVDSKRKRPTDSSSDLDEEGSGSDLDEEGIDHDENDIASKVDSKRKRPTDSSSDLDEEGIDHDENDIASKVDSKRKRRADSSSDLDEEGITRDVNFNSLYIKKYKVKKPRSKPGQSKGVRIYDNYHACFFCEKIVLHINEHLKTHRNQDMVKNILKGECRDFTLLRKLGDDRHNRKCVEMKKGEIILARRPTGKFDVKDYGPCPDCREWVMLEHMKLHNKHCQIHENKTVKPKGKDLVFQAQVLAGHFKNEPSTLMCKEVLPIMTRDNISETAKNDQLIMALGESWLRRNRGNVEKRKYYASARMRLCARLFLALQGIKSNDSEDEKTNLKEVENGEEENEEFAPEGQVSKANNFQELWNYLRPKHFDAIVLAAIKCAIPNADDEDDLLAPSNAIKLKYDLRRLINSKWATLVRNAVSEDEEAKECKTLLALMDLEWEEKVTRFARLVLARRKYECVKEIPSPKDIETITSYLTKELKDLPHKPEHYRRLVVLCQARLLLYNKRRSGEIEAIKLQSYASRNTETDDIDESLKSGLSRVEKHLLESQEFFQVRGKRGRPVPVIIPPDTKEVLKFLASANVRKQSGIACGNPYLFPNSVNHYARAYESLKAICAELDLVAPHRITSVSMRKYMATLTQILNLDKHQLEWVYNHLGHTRKVHREHYRQTSSLIERTQISKLLLIQDLNLTSQFKGKKIEDLDIQDIVMPDKIEDAQSDQLSIPLDSLTVDPEEVAHVEATDIMETAEEEEEEEEQNDLAVKKRCVRQRWTIDEIQELKKWFSGFLQSKTTPRQDAIEQAKKKSKKAGGVIHLRANHLIVKKISNMNHANN